MASYDTAAVLGEQTTEIIGKCLTAWATGPFIEEWEFPTVTGMERDEVREIAEAWPMVVSDNVCQAVEASIGNLLGYPHGASVVRRTGYDETAIKQALIQWRASPFCA